MDTMMDLSKFGYRELELAKEILTAIIEHGYPDDFEDDGVSIAFNPISNYVFLTNDEYQVAMVVDGKLESWYSTPYSGHEGFYSDLVDDMKSYPKNWNDEDIEYMKNLAEAHDDYDTVEWCENKLES